jgi:alkylation response protein AidB-like acyl-CoA dehydrogenase
MEDLFTLPEEHRMLRATVRALAEKEIAPHAATADERCAFPRAAYEALVRAGLHAAHVPEEYGGAGADALAVCVIVEEVARACATTALIPSVTKVATMPLILAGTPEQKRRYLVPVARDAALFSYALSEPEAGSDAAAIRTRAVRDGDGYVIEGTKRWITHAGESAFYTVMAVTDRAAGPRGISAFVVEVGDPGLSFGPPERKLGLRGSPTREVHLDGVRVGADRMVGPPGSGLSTAMAALEHSRITIAAQAVGIAQGALDHAVDYIRQRRQFGKAIAEFQGIRFMVADMAMSLESARQLTYVAAAKAERGDPDARYFSSASKCLASDVAMQVTTDAVQLLGGAGYVRDHPVERMMRDAKATQIYEGTNQIQRAVMARCLLT